MFPTHIHRYIFLFGICTLGSGIALGEVPTSIAEIILFSNWVFEGRFKEKLNIMRTNKLLWLLCSVFLIHIAGLIYTSDIERGLNDIRIKIPLMLLPLVYFTSAPLSKKELTVLFYLFILGVLMNCTWCLIYYFTHPGIDLRAASRWVSHIRLGLLIDTAICLLIYLIADENKRNLKLTFAAIIIFFLAFMVKMSLITGLVIFVIVGSMYAFFAGFKRNLRMKIASIASVLIIVSGIVIFISREWRAYNFIDPSPLNKPLERSVSGRLYYPVQDSRHTENGFFIAYNIQYEEIAHEWPKRSNVLLYSSQKGSGQLSWTLIRYLTSKGYTKDSVGINKLSQEDISNIENGVTNYKYAHVPELRKRLREFFWEYQDYVDHSNPSGNTMLMRFEFWKAAVYIIKRNALYGVGTGDAQKAFNKAYIRTNSDLAHEWRLRSHNQFLAIAVSFGVIAGLFFIFYIFYPYFRYRKYIHPVYTAFFIIAVISFITEDTLETQTGVTFFAHFNTLFIWIASVRKAEEKETLIRNDNL